MNKKALAEEIALKTGITKKAATETVEYVFEAFVNTLKAGGKVDISGFGKFEVKDRAERQGINPATKEKITVAATKVPAFKASKTLKDIIKAK